MIKYTTIVLVIVSLLPVICMALNPGDTCKDTDCNKCSENFKVTSDAKDVCGGCPVNTFNICDKYNDASTIETCCKSCPQDTFLTCSNTYAPGNSLKTCCNACPQDTFLTCSNTYAPGNSLKTCCNACPPDKFLTCSNTYAAGNSLETCCNACDNSWYNTCTSYSAVNNVDACCDQCSASCVQCSGILNCTKCKLKFFVNNGVCQSCHSSCETCQGTKSFNCLTCVEPNFVSVTNVTNTTGVCISACSARQFPKSVSGALKICTNCSDHCAECSTAEACVKCDDSYFLDTQKDCAKCDSSCKSCNGIGTNKCTACPTEKRLKLAKVKDKAGSCVDSDSTCPDQFYMSSLTGAFACVPCKDENCLTCSNTECQKCKSPYVLIDGICKQQIIQTEEQSNVESTVGEKVKFSLTIVDTRLVDVTYLCQASPSNLACSTHPIVATVNGASFTAIDCECTKIGSTDVILKAVSIEPSLSVEFTFAVSCKAALPTTTSTPIIKPTHIEVDDTYPESNDSTSSSDNSETIAIVIVVLLVLGMAGYYLYRVKFQGKRGAPKYQRVKSEAENGPLPNMVSVY